VILETKGNIFVGFTPVKSESRYDFKKDDSLKSFCADAEEFTQCNGEEICIEGGKEGADNLL
jgi:hypothetical protein